MSSRPVHPLELACGRGGCLGAQMFAWLIRGAVAVAFDQPLLLIRAPEASYRLPHVFERPKRSIQSACSLSVHGHIRDHDLGAHLGEPGARSRRRSRPAPPVTIAEALVRSMRTPKV